MEEATATTTKAQAKAAAPRRGWKQLLSLAQPDFPLDDSANTAHERGVASVRCDPIARGMMAAGWHKKPFKWALLIVTVNAVVTTPSNILISLTAPPETIPIWKDYWALFYVVFWVILLRGYLSQPRLLTDTLRDAAGLVQSGKGTAQWAVWCMGFWFWSLAAVTFIATASAWWIGHGPHFDFYYALYRPYYYAVWALPIAVIFYIALVAATRQVIAGIATALLMSRFQPTTSAANITAVNTMRKIAERLVQLVVPFALGGIAMGGWMATELLGRGAGGNPFMFTGFVLYIPVLTLSLPLPLLYLFLAMAAIRGHERQTVDSAIATLYLQADPIQCESAELQTSNVRMRLLQERWRLSQHLFPVIPVSAVRLRLVAVAASLEVVAGLLAIALYCVQLANQ
jgi:hypothetical protein